MPRRSAYSDGGPAALRSRRWVNERCRTAEATGELSLGGLAGDRESAVERGFGGRIERIHPPVHSAEPGNDSLAGRGVIALLGGQINRLSVVPDPRLLKRAGQRGGAQLGEDEPFVERPAHPVEPGDPRLPGRDEIAGRCGVGCLEGKVGVNADEVERLPE